MRQEQWIRLEERVRATAERAIAERVFSGCVVGALVDGETRIWSCGADDFDGKGEPMSAERVFDIASLTKVFPTSTLALRAIAEQRLDLYAPVAEFIPEFSRHHDRQAQVFHLLTHSLDYRFPLSSLKDLPARELFARLCAHPFQAAPGSLFNYGNAASILLGRVLNAVYGKNLHELGTEYFFQPLGLHDSGWNPLERVAPERIVPTENCPWRGRILRGEIHDESACALRDLGPVGSAGMFSTVPDLLRFVTHVLQQPAYLERICRNALAHLPGVCTGLGWELDNPRFMGSRAPSGTFGKTGFTGQSIVANAQQQCALVLLSNFTWPQREKTPDRIYTIRAELADYLFDCITGVPLPYNIV